MRNRRRYGWPDGRIAETPVREARRVPRDVLAATMRERAHTYRLYAAIAVDPVHRRRCLRASRDYIALARQAERGIALDGDDDN